MDGLRMLLGGGEPTDAEVIAAYRPTTLPEARVEHLEDIFRRQGDNTFPAGSIVMPTADSRVNAAFVGEPHVVLFVRPEDAVPEEWGDTHYIATLGKDGGVIGSWVSVWRLETYLPRR